MDDNQQYADMNDITSMNFMKIRNLEEKQKIMKDRLMLISQNLIDTKEDFQGELTELKKQNQNLREKLKRLISFIETASSEFSKFAKKSDLEILTKQAKMFQPLEFVRKSDLKKHQE